MRTGKGLLRHPPTAEELERLYHELALLGAPSVGRRRRWAYGVASREALLALAGEMLRYDPRLLSILLEYVLKHHTELNPRALRREMGDMRWPQALLVVFEFARVAEDDRELRYMADYLGAGHERVNPAERFFLDVDRPASRTATRRAGRNLNPYKRWGFIGTERPTASVASKRLVGTSDSGSRALVRADLVRRHGSFTVADYLDALDHAISRQQAYQDLRADETLELRGRGRGARWHAHA